MRTSVTIASFVSFLMFILILINLVSSYLFKCSFKFQVLFLLAAILFASGAYFKLRVGRYFRLIFAVLCPVVFFLFNSIGHTILIACSDNPQKELSPTMKKNIYNAISDVEVVDCTKVQPCLHEMIMDLKSNKEKQLATVVRNGKREIVLIDIDEAVTHILLDLDYEDFLSVSFKEIDKAGALKDFFLDVDEKEYLESQVLEIVKRSGEIYGVFIFPDKVSKELKLLNKP